MMFWADRFKAFRALVIATSTWQTWVDSVDSATLSARISWPIRRANLSDFPFINLTPGQSSLRNESGFDAGAVWIPSGSLQFRLWDVDSDPTDPTASFEAFDANVSQLLQDLQDAWQNGPLVVRGLMTDEPTIVHSHDNAFLLGESPDDELPVWLFSASIMWGFVS